MAEFALGWADTQNRYASTTCATVCAPLATHTHSLYPFRTNILSFSSQIYFPGESIEANSTECVCMCVYYFKKPNKGVCVWFNKKWPNLHCSVYWGKRGGGTMRNEMRERVELHNNVGVSVPPPTSICRASILKILRREIREREDRKDRRRSWLVRVNWCGWLLVLRGGGPGR